MTKTLAVNHVRQLIQDRFPGVTLKSDVQAWALLRLFQQGRDYYQNLDAPTPDDDRWAGVCLFNMLEDLRAVELYYRAISRGCEAARINLAHSLTYIERGDEVLGELAKLSITDLSEYDQVLLLRVRSMYQEGNGNLANGLDDISQAWQIAEHSLDAAPIIPEVLSQLAVLESRVGFGLRALDHIKKAISYSIDPESVALRLVSAHVLLILGRFGQAKLELDRIETQIESDSAPMATLSVQRAEIEWANGSLDSAVQSYRTAISIASEASVGFEELLSHLGLAAIHGHLGDLDLAFEHLSKAEILIGDRSDRIIYRLREVLLRHQAGSYGPMTALLELEALIDELHDMGALQEEGRVRLHAANMLWKMDSEKLDSRQYVRQLDKLQELVESLQNSGFLAREWVLMADFREVAARTHPLLLRTGRPELRIVSLGRGALLLNGEPVALSASHGLGILAFLMDRPAARLEEILDGALPHEKRASARSYFHQFRNQLAREVPELRIAFDRGTETYSLESSLPLAWDVAERRSSPVDDPAAAVAIFLPGLETSWTREIRAELSYETDGAELSDAQTRL